ncbi:MAG: molybdopterin-dependent oxidoreductase, partial [Phycisphaerales bacterium]|nr:molybdopterin-dependent oxidoreductase [Phycisphaerales bacterium]
VKPRFNGSVNKWWITDEVRHGWKFIHRDDRLTQPMRRQFGARTPAPWQRAIPEAATALSAVESTGKRLAVMVSPMLSCEDAYALARAAIAIDGNCVLAVGPIPVHGHDKVFPAGIKADDPKAFTMFAEKAPNARGVRRVLEALAIQHGLGGVATYEQLLAELRVSTIGAAIITGNYPSEWVTTDLVEATKGKTLVVIDTLPTALSEAAEVLLPGATWAEKAGCFQSARGVVQAFEQAIPVREGAKPEAQIGLDLLAAVTGGLPAVFNAADLRTQMGEDVPALAPLAATAQPAPVQTAVEPDMAMVEL